jgi:hypothetical protein
MSIADQDLLPADAARAQFLVDLDLIDEAHQRMRDTSTDLVGTAFRVEVAGRLETQARVNRGLSYRMFGEIADPVDDFGNPDLPPGVRARDLLWQRLRLTRGEITRRFRLAARVRPRRSLIGPALPPVLPELAAAIEAGDLGEDHIATVTRALDHLPSKATPADQEHAEYLLVANARQHDAPFVAVVGRAIADTIAERTGQYCDTDRARRRYLTLGPQQLDGMSRLTGYLDPATRAYLEPIIAAVRPGHHQPDDPGTGTPQPDLRDEGQRAHDALNLALRHAIESGKLGTHRGVPVTVIVTTTLGEINQAAHAITDPAIAMPAPARTGGGSRLPMRDLIRMAADSIHYLAVFDDHTKRPLYLGRSKRIATTDHRIICHARDRGCTRPNCTQPGYRCEVHHCPGWARGGRTNPDELWFACPRDHSGETRGHYTTAPTNGRLAWTDGTAPPQVNHAHHPDELLADPDPPPS